MTATTSPAAPEWLSRGEFAPNACYTTALRSWVVSQQLSDSCSQPCFTSFASRVVRLTEPLREDERDVRLVVLAILLRERHLDRCKEH